MDKKRLLLAEDDELLASLLNYRLEKSGYQVSLSNNGKEVKGKGYIIDDLTNKAMDFMQENKDKPFLCYVPYNTPHSPFQVPDVWYDKFKDKKIDLDHRYKGEEKLDVTRAVLAMCENIDWNVGRIKEKLKQLELLQNTIIIYLRKRE